MDEHSHNIEFWELPKEPLCTKRQILRELAGPSVDVMTVLAVDLWPGGITYEIANVLRWDTDGVKEDCGREDDSDSWPPPIRVEVKHGTPRRWVAESLRFLSQLADDDESWSRFLHEASEPCGYHGNWEYQGDGKADNKGSQ